MRIFPCDGVSAIEDKWKQSQPQQTETLQKQQKVIRYCPVFKRGRNQTETTDECMSLLYLISQAGRRYIEPVGWCQGESKSLYWSDFF
jgi:hypothetical protein